MDAMGRLICVFMIALALVFTLTAMAHHHASVPCFIIVPLGLAGFFFARSAPRRARRYQAQATPEWAQTCPGCGRSVANRPGANFCPVCGTPLQG